MLDNQSGSISVHFLNSDSGMCSNPIYRHCFTTMAVYWMAAHVLFLKEQDKLLRCLSSIMIPDMHNENLI